jgi:DNA mismatch repair protein MutS
MADSLDRRLPAARPRRAATGEPGAPGPEAPVPSGPGSATASFPEAGSPQQDRPARGGTPVPDLAEPAAAPAGAADLTPMMRQYREWKRRYPEYLLLFRLGDFYEAFHEDAAVAARTLDITLTSRQKGEGAIPMAGVPHHALDAYVARLIRAGLKVAICDQVESAPAKGRKLIRREVVRLVTPGTVTEAGLLDGRRNNFLAALWRGADQLGLALVDITTADFWVGEAADADGLTEALLLRRPAEVLVPVALLPDDAALGRLRAAGVAVTVRPPASFGLREAEERLRTHFHVAAIEALGLPRRGPALRAAGAVLEYLVETQQAPPAHLTRIQTLALDDHLVLDESAARNLELVESLHDRTTTGTLLWAIDRTLTPMGGRLLRQWLLRPLRAPAEIAERLAAVQALVDAPAALALLRERLAGIGDLARLASRVALGSASPRDLAALRAALRRLPGVREAAREFPDGLLRDATAGIDDLAALEKTLEAALVDDPPPGVHDGGLIRESWSPALAELRREVREARSWIAGLEGRERERTGIASLRVRYNRVFGYGIEVPRSHTRAVPPEYIRRQTLVGAERYVTEELRVQEALVLGAEGRMTRLEFELFDELRRTVAGEADRLLRSARAVAVLDVVAGLAQVAHERGYARPVVDDTGVLEIEDGRHPVLELGGDGARFVPNDVRLLPGEVECLVITGPNMAGKSTYMRQVALTVLLAQVGSFVPARRARIGVVDRIFTRIGAQDDLARGQSTFLVEMTETAAILRHATGRSLVLLDEIGRGTSTFDGLSIAWAVAEFLHERRPGAKVLFATHYHELTRLAAELPRVRNVHVAVREWSDDIVFLHRVVPGGTDRSYGIQVARLAGLPAEVVARARALLREFEQGAPAPAGPGDGEDGQLALFGRAAGSPAENGPPAVPPAPHPVLAALAGLDPDRMTPLEALAALHELRRRLTGPP